MKKIAIILLLVGAGYTLSAAQDSIEWVSDTMTMADSVTVEEIPSITSTAQPETPIEEPKQASSGLGWLVMACGITAILALGAGALAFFTRRELVETKNAMRIELENTHENIRQLADESSREINTLREALRAHLTRVPHDELPARIAAMEKKKGETSDSQRRKAGPHSIYLAKPDAQDSFTRASEHFELGNSLFVLTTSDDRHGTYTVIDNADVHRFALMMPTDNLTRACTGTGIQISTGKTRIITDEPGEAVFDNGVWRITRKAVIHYM